MSIRELCEMVCSGSEAPTDPCLFNVKSVEYVMEEFEGMNYLRESVAEDISFYQPDEVLTYLFDKDVFGWEVQSYSIELLSDTGCTTMRIELYRMK